MRCARKVRLMTGFLTIVCRSPLPQNVNGRKIYHECFFNLTMTLAPENPAPAGPLYIVCYFLTVAPSQDPLVVWGC